MLNVENLTFRYSRHAPPVLSGVNLSLNPGEIGILLGKTAPARPPASRTFWEFSPPPVEESALTGRIC